MVPLDSWFSLAAANNLDISWWRHQMETFSALLAICAGNSPVIGEFPVQRPVMQSFDVFFDLRLNKRLSKPPRGGNLRRHRTHYYVIVMFPYNLKTARDSSKTYLILGSKR